MELLLYSDYAASHYTANDITTYSNKFFATTGGSVNTAYLEDTYGAVGFAGDVVICPISGTSGNYDLGGWMTQGDAAATAQGYTPGNYAHRVYIVSGAGGWAGLAAVGGGWSMDFYTDGGTITHELGHNLGFNHASTQWNNTSGWDEYGDSSDFMGGSYDWRHNNGPHKVQLGWITPQTVTNGGTYQISRIEDIPSSVPYPQVLKVNSSTPPNNWPYFFSYKQPLGFDVNNGQNAGVSIHRYNDAGGNTALVAYLSDGGSFTDTASGMTVKQITHNTNAVTVVIVPQILVAQPFTFLLTSEQLDARTPVPVDVAANTGPDPLTVTGFDAVTLNGGTVTLTNNQLFYTPPGIFSGNDSFNYTVVDMLGTQSSSVVTIIPMTQPHYNWDANGAVAGTGGTGNWNTSLLTWDDGTHSWPATGTTNWALFGGTAGTVSIANGGAAANGLAFRADGYILRSNTITFNGTAPAVYADTAVNGTINAVVAGTAGLTKTGLGTVTLGAANTFTGPKIISQGTLAANHASALGASSASLTLGDTNSGTCLASFKVDSAVSSAVVLSAVNVTSNSLNPSLVLNAGSALGANASELIVANLNLNGNAPLTIQATSTGTSHSTAQDIVYRVTGNGVPAGSTALILDGAAKQLRTSFLNGSAANSFSGDVIIKGDVKTQNLTYNSQTAANQNLGFTNNNVSVDSGATWTLVWGGETVGALNGTGDVVMNNQNALNNIGLTIGNNRASGNFSGGISGDFGVLKTGAGTQTFSGANSYSGTTTISQGTLTLNNGSALPASAVVVLGDSKTGTNTPTLGVSQAVTLGALTVAANVTNATIYATPAGNYFLTISNVTLNGPLKISKANMGGNWQGFQTTGKITGFGAGPGNDTLILMNAGGAQAYWQANNTANDFLGNVHFKSGEWRIQNGGGNNLVIPDTASVTVDSGVALNFSSAGLPETIDGLNGSGTVSRNVNETAALTVGASGGSGSFGGVIQNGNGTFALTKIGAGAQILSGANTYTGSTVISNGLLAVNGTLASGSAVMVAGGALGGTGTVRGPVTVQANGTIAPGVGGIGTLTLNASPSLGGRVLMAISKGATPNASKLLVSGQPLTYAGTLTVTNIGTNAFAAGDAFTLFGATGFSGNFTATNLPPLSPGLAWNWSPASGTLAVISTVNTTPTNIVFSASNGQLTLNWPADHTGWKLQSQTNDLNTGLTDNWFDIPDSTATNQMTFWIDSSGPTVFYRLKFP